MNLAGLFLATLAGPRCWSDSLPAVLLPDGQTSHPGIIAVWITTISDPPHLHLSEQG